MVLVLRIEEGSENMWINSRTEGTRGVPLTQKVTTGTEKDTVF